MLHQPINIDKEISKAKIILNLEKLTKKKNISKYFKQIPKKFES